MGNTLNSGILFSLSGISQGNYIFEQNPVSYDIMTPYQNIKVLPILVGGNIYQYTLLDNEIRVMNWDEASTNLYLNLKNYCQRDVFGAIIPSYFSDGTVLEFQNKLVEVIDVYGQPIAAKDGKWKIKLTFKPISPYQSKYIF